MNFSPGPGAIPLPALLRSRDELIDLDGTGIGVGEHSHRGKQYSALHAETKQLLRDLLALDDSWEILFLQGGASGQFAQLPMNFLGADARADYVVTGTWGEHAVAEAKRSTRGKIQIAGNSGTGGDPTKELPGAAFSRVVTPSEVRVDPAATYVHCTSNETVHGVQFHGAADTWFPTNGVPLVCDMSSDFLEGPIDFSPFSFVYAGAQKNFGPAGLVVAIAKKEFLARAKTDAPLPNCLSYAVQAKNDSLYNTPPTVSMCIARNVLRWLSDLGGLAAMGERNRAKAAVLYGALDKASGFYNAPVEPSSRSRMNVVFRLPTEDLEARFVKEADAAGLFGLKGHRSVGGIRASIYNAVEPESVNALAAFVADFAARNG